MTNPFEELPIGNNYEDPDKKPGDLEGVNLEKLTQNIEDSSVVELNKFEKSDDDFINEQKREFGIFDNDPELDAEVEAIKEKYRKQREGLGKRFLSAIKSVAKYIPEGLVALAFAGHFSQKELPDYLEKVDEKKTELVTWNESTRQEIDELSHDYTLAMKSDSVYKNIPDSVFENRFKDFVATWGPHIKIVHPGDDMDLSDKINEWIFQNIYRQPNNRAHYLGETLFYVNKDLKEKVVDPNFDFNPTDTAKQYDMGTSSLGDFCAEFSHHINGDWSLGRSLAYVEDLAKQDFDQQKMYDDPYSGEYQAHSIAEDAIYRYLFPENNNLDLDFVDVYNTFQDYYREFIRVKAFEGNHYIDWATLQSKNFNDILKDKKVVFQNLERIRGVVDNLDASNTLRDDLFRILTDDFPLEKTDNNYEIIINNAESVGEILEAKKLALENPKEFFDDFAKILEQKYVTDYEYVYTSLNREFFDDQLLDSMKKTAETIGQNSNIEKLYKLNIFGKARSIESLGFGYKNYDSHPFQYVCEEYESYLKKINQHLRGDLTLGGAEEIINNEEKIARIKGEKLLGYILDSYIKNDKDHLDSDFSYYYNNNSQFDWEEPFIFNLKFGLSEYGSPDLKRDFFENGRSPLYRILK